MPLQKTDRRKVAVVTLAGRFNYGNRLQNYAVHQILNERGCEAETIEFVDTNPVKVSKNFVKRLLGRDVPSRESQMTPQRRLAFEEFQRFLPTREVSVYRRGFVRDYDLFVVGSDQVWNPRFMAFTRPELLWFAPHEKRVALSASVGLRSLDRRYRRRFSKRLREFAHISVREDTAADIVESLVGMRPPVLVDPTLMLDPDRWRKVSSDRLVPSMPYVFCYCLGDDNANVVEACRRMADMYGADDIVTMSDRDLTGELPAGPQDFVSLIDHAEAVVTDSFHGSIFSILFSKPFCVFKRVGGSDMFSRMESLLGGLGLTNRIVSETKPDWLALGQAPNYEEVNRCLALRRHEFDVFVDECLAG